MVSAVSEYSLSYSRGVSVAVATPEPPDRPEHPENVESSVLRGSSEPPRRQRVAALAPDDRRAALIDATIPLLRVYGLHLTTRQIADAAGVAEGTIFGVFHDKNSLIRAALIKCFDPEPGVSAINGVRTVEDLRERLIMIVSVLSHGVEMMAPLMASIRANSGMVDDPELMHAMIGTRDAIGRAVAAAIEPDRDKLRRSPEAVAQTLLYMIFASGADFAAPEATTPRELVSLLLDGLLVRNHATTLPGESSC
jgi:AcrR family transcriptional regulator